jgi:hypothetical protein
MRAQFAGLVVEGIAGLRLSVLDSSMAPTNSLIGRTPSRLIRQFILMFIVFYGLNAAAGEDVQLRIVRRHKAVQAQDPARLITNVISFAKSASVDATAQGGGAAGWESVLTSGSFIRLTFPTPRTFRVPVMVERVQKWEERPINEILIWLREGSYPVIYLRNGSDYRVVTMWQPVALARLVKDPGLELATVAPYDHFYKLESGN